MNRNESHEPLPLTVAAVALNQTPLDWDGNRDRVLTAIERGREEGASWLCLPELCLTGYGCEDAFLSPNTAAMALRVLAEVLPATRGLVATVGLPVWHGGGLFNAAAVLVDGALKGLVCKQNLANDGLHYEARWFRAWPRGERAVLDAGDALGGEVPMGDLVFSVGGVRLGFEICEDAWVADRPGAGLAARGVDVLFNPSASHFAFEKVAVREGIVTRGSADYGVAYVYSNLLGNEAGRAVYDGHTMIATQGEVVAEGPRLSFDAVVVTPWVVDVAAVRSERGARAVDTAGEVVVDGVGEVSGASGLKPARRDGRSVWRSSKRSKEEAFTRVIALALFDYARKSRSKGFVVSLSGGADSAAVACLVREAVVLGVAELGPDAFAAALGVTPGTVDELCGRLLTTVYQATRNSSGTTRDAARAVAVACGATHHELDVDALVEGYTQRIEGAIGRGLAWATDDLAMQNIQARVRAPGVWMLANLEGKLLLSTSNRSEAAVGYATMDGDTAGGLSPIAGIDKAFLREWLRWMETDGPVGGAPIRELKLVNQQAPTAELRPSGEGQTDEGDLMPYPLLDDIEDAAIGRRRGPAAVYAEVRGRWPEYGDEQTLAWVERFYRLWSRNQWKRERYAPAFHVDDRNLDPRTWCRWPILSGGFERELRELRAAVLGGG